MGESCGGESGNLIGEKLGKIIENGERVHYFVGKDGRLTKEAYRSRRWVEVEP